MAARVTVVAAHQRAFAQNNDDGGGSTLVHWRPQQRSRPPRQDSSRRSALQRTRVTVLLYFSATLLRKEAAAQSQCETGEADLDAVTSTWGGRDPYPFAAQSCETTNDAEAEAAGALAACPPLAPR